jgi:hypothetical protein
MLIPYNKNEGQNQNISINISDQSFERVVKIKVLYWEIQVSDCVVLMMILTAQ